MISGCFIRTQSPKEPERNKMSESSSSSSSGGIGVVGLLGVLFVGLKLGGVIDWSWWYVTLPFWGGLALVLGIFAIVAVIAGLVAMCTSLFGGKTKVVAKRRPLERR